MTSSEIVSLLNFLSFSHCSYPEVTVKSLTVTFPPQGGGGGGGDGGK